jgi:isoleucyl-tRNA synthetase
LFTFAAAFAVQVIDWLEGQSIGKRQVNYKLRDWLFARQRYWGEPFPLLYPGELLHTGIRVHHQFSKGVSGVFELTLPITGW